MFFAVNALIYYLVSAILLPSDKYGELFVIHNLPEAQWRLYFWVRIALCIIPMTMALYSNWSLYDNSKLIAILWVLIVIACCIFNGALHLLQNRIHWDYSYESNTVMSVNHSYEPYFFIFNSLIVQPFVTLVISFFGALSILLSIQFVKRKLTPKKH